MLTLTLRFRSNTMRRLTISLLRCLAKLSGAGRAHNGANERAAEADILTARQAISSFAPRPPPICPSSLPWKSGKLACICMKLSSRRAPGPAQLFAKRIGQDKGHRPAGGRRTKDDGLRTTEYGGEGQTKLHELAKNERKNKVPLPRRWANNGGYTGATCRTFRIMCVQKMC